MALRDQLAALRPAQRRRGRASLLFSAQEAEDIDTTTLFHLGVNGFTELCRLDGRFLPFRETLFDRSAKDLDRARETKDVNVKLDESIASFLRRLSPYFLLRPAHKVLEYFIRRFECVMDGCQVISPVDILLRNTERKRSIIHERNVREVFECIFPYHETNMFVRMVQTMNLSGTEFGFLRGVQRSGAPLVRRVLVQQCRKDPAVLDFVCHMARNVADPTFNYRGVLTFFTVVVREVLAMDPAPDRALVARLLPHMLDSVNRPSVPEQLDAGLILVVQLSERVPLEASVFRSLTRAVAQHVGDTTASQSNPLLALASIYAAQERWMEPADGVTAKAPLAVAPKALRALLKTDPTALGETLDQLGQEFDIGPLTRALAHAAVEFLGPHPDKGTAVRRFLAALPLERDAEEIVERLIFLFASHVTARSDGRYPTENGSDDDAVGAALQTVLRQLCSRYPSAADGGLRRALTGSRGSRHRRTSGVVSDPDFRSDESGSDDDDKDKDTDSVQHPAVLRWLQASLDGSQHMPVALTMRVEDETSAAQPKEERPVTTGTLTLSLSLTHPQGRVRRQAMHHLEELVQRLQQEEEMDPGTSAFIQNSILDRQADESSRVVAHALRLEAEWVHDGRRPPCMRHSVGPSGSPEPIRSRPGDVVRRVAEIVDRWSPVAGAVTSRARHARMAVHAALYYIGGALVQWMLGQTDEAGNDERNEEEIGSAKDEVVRLLLGHFPVGGEPVGRTAQTAIQWAAKSPDAHPLWRHVDLEALGMENDEPPPHHPPAEGDASDEEVEKNGSESMVRFLGVPPGMEVAPLRRKRHVQSIFLTPLIRWIPSKYGTVEYTNTIRPTDAATVATSIP